MKKITKIFIVAFALIMLLSVPVGAYSSYQTYTYSINEEPLFSPDAYIPRPDGPYDSTYMMLDTPLSEPSDMVVDGNGNVYIADNGTKQVVVLDRYYKQKFTISTFTNEIGAPDSLDSPRGVFVTDNKYDGYGELKELGKIYVCDSLKYRIVVFDLEGNFLYVLDAPESELFGDSAVYTPVAVAVDQYSRIYVVSSSTTQGVIVLTADGEFTGFIGAPEVSISAWDIIWRRFQTEEQRKLSSSFVPVTFSNVAITPDGFVYASSSYEESMPVRLLNNAGSEIMKRNGFTAPYGEAAFATSSTDTNMPLGASTIGDVAVGESGTWSLTDTKRSKIFTYDYDGNLLFAFGDRGNLQLGNISNIKAIAYQGDVLLVLDAGTNKSITAYERTEYSRVLYQAVSDQLNRQYDRSIENWTEVLMRNSNFDAAYIGIGQSLFRDGQYEKAIEQYKAAYDTDNYSAAYQELRKQTIEDIFLLIPIVIVALCLGLSFLMKKISKINIRAATSGEKITFGKELLFGFHILTHPFDGFWDLKHEKRGSVRAAVVYLAVTVIAFYYQAIGQGYLFNPLGNYSTIFMQIIGVAMPVLLFVIANWCLTTLFEGEGSMKDIFITTCYSLLPLPLIIIPATIASNVVTGNEKDIVTLLIAFAFIWVGFLLVFGVQVTHDYSLGKNVVTIIATIVGMVFIMFIAILFTTLLGKVVGFVSNIFIELSYRM